MNADDGGRSRDRLASRRTLLAYIPTSLSFACLGFAVAKSGLNPKMAHVAIFLGTFTVVVGLVFTLAGLAQHRAGLLKIDGSRPAAPALSRSFHVAALAGSALVCALLLAVYLVTSAT